MNYNHQRVFTAMMETQSKDCSYYISVTGWERISGQKHFSAVGRKSKLFLQS